MPIHTSHLSHHISCFRASMCAWQLQLAAILLLNIIHTSAAYWSSTCTPVGIKIRALPIIHPGCALWEFCKSSIPAARWHPQLRRQPAQQRRPTAARSQCICRPDAKCCWAVSFLQVLEYAARWHPDQEIISKSVEGPIVVSTYADLAQRAKLCAVALQRLGIRCAS